jgi:hypothetical protein
MLRWRSLSVHVNAPCSAVTWQLLGLGPVPMLHVDAVLGIVKTKADARHAATTHGFLDIRFNGSKFACSKEKRAIDQRNLPPGQPEVSERVR